MPAGADPTLPNPVPVRVTVKANNEDFVGNVGVDCDSPDSLKAPTT
jgi:hypothetical protein